ncbi:MAG: mandelate racemase [Acidobacteriota bacterium]
MNRVNKVCVREAEVYEREIRFRFPFRFGVVTLSQAPQALVRVRILLQNGRSAWGVAAELLAPKWFDKSPALSNRDNVEQLRTSLRLAVELYTATRAHLTPFDHFVSHYEVQNQACASRGLNSLIAGFGPALLDRAILDALCRALDISFFDAVRGNLPGLRGLEAASDLEGFGLDSFLAGLGAETSLHIRHTVGLSDPLTEADLPPGSRLNDGLPETLEKVLRVYGNAYFKIKLFGDTRKDVQRLSRIAALLDRTSSPYRITLDGNEQFPGVEAVGELLEAIQAAPVLKRFSRSILFVEQPIERGVALSRDVTCVSSEVPLTIDESDSSLDSFPLARRRGYKGVSSKTCKGMYKSLLNAARCARWNAEGQGRRFFLSGEDLTTLPGVGLQQDLALASILGLHHVERNGHHYVKGMSAFSPAEQQAFLRAHPDLYKMEKELVLLRLERGQVQIGSLHCPGFAVAAEPDWSATRRMTLDPL